MIWDVSSVTLAVMQGGIIVVISAEKWVHRVTGGTSLEARIDAVERGQAATSVMIDRANERLSEKLSEIQKAIGSMQLDQARQEEHFRSTDRDLQNLKAAIDRRREPRE